MTVALPPLRHRLVTLALALLSSACGAASLPTPELASAALPVPIYRETLRDSPYPRYFFSTRTSAEAERFGWQQLGIAFYAYVTPVPGTVPIYCETPASAPHSDYRFSSRPEAAVLEDGWMRLNLAFYAYPDARPATVPVFLESPVGSELGPFGLSTRSAEDARGFGWSQAGIAFHALAPGSIRRAPG